MCVSKLACIGIVGVGASQSQPSVESLVISPPPSNELLHPTTNRYSPIAHTGFILNIRGGDSWFKAEA